MTIARWCFQLLVRGNTSVIIRVVKDSASGGDKGDKEAGSTTREAKGEESDEAEEARNVRHVQIDVGKTWREGIIRWFPRSG